MTTYFMPGHRIVIVNREIHFWPVTPMWFWEMEI